MKFLNIQFCSMVVAVVITTLAFSFIRNSEAFIPYPCFNQFHSMRTSCPSLRYNHYYYLSSKPGDENYPQITDNAPSWDTLMKMVMETPTGKRLEQESKEHSIGLGPAHTDASIRLFDAAKNNEANIRVILYRDQAAWCPYCQKVWLLLEEKRIPYRVVKVPLNAYGDKPAWFTRLVDGGKLPAIELDGDLITGSLDIMKLLDNTFKDHGPRMVPTENSYEAELYNEFLELEKELQRDWFSLTFYPLEGEALNKTRNLFLNTLKKVNHALSITPGPWFLGDTSPSLLDLHYISTMERIEASVLYWKGLKIRSESFNNLERWFNEFESRPAYLATKSDYYTHVMAMPSQNGPGYAIDEAKDVAAQITGLDEAWSLHSNDATDNSDSDLSLYGAQYDEATSRHEAAYRVISNHKNITRFATRGAGEPGRPSYHAELADPYAEPNESYMGAVDICLRHVSAALLVGAKEQAQKAGADLTGQAGSGELRTEWEAYEDDDGHTYYWNYETGDVAWTPPTRQLDTCLAYLRDRIGVPRDMGPGAAMILRTHLNWAIELLNSRQ